MLTIRDRFAFCSELAACGIVAVTAPRTRLGCEKRNACGSYGGLSGLRMLHLEEVQIMESPSAKTLSMSQYASV